MLIKKTKSIIVSKVSISETGKQDLRNGKNSLKKGKHKYIHWYLEYAIYWKNTKFLDKNK